MSLSEHRPASWHARVYGARFVIVAAAIVFAGLALRGTLRVGAGACGLCDLVRRPRGSASAAIADRRTAAGDHAARCAPVTRCSAVVAGLPDPVIALDRDGRVLAFNAARARSRRRCGAASRSRSALRMPEVVEAIRRATASGEAQRVEYSERVPVDRWFEAIVTPVRAAGRTCPIWCCMTFHDLTPLRRVEEMRADFVANASHELRTPLAALSGFIETLQGPARDDASARERFLAIMQAQATRMARLIDDLLSLSRIELNAHMRPDTPVDLVPIVRQVVDGLQTLARDRGVERQRRRAATRR